MLWKRRDARKSFIPVVFEQRVLARLNRRIFQQKNFTQSGNFPSSKKKNKKKISALILPITNPSLWWKYIRRWAQKDRSACDLNASYSKYHSDDPITLTLNFRVKNLVATYHINLPWLMLIQTDKCSSNDWIDHIWAWWCSEVQRDA